MHEFTFRPNPNKEQCQQCSLGMVIQALTGEDLSLSTLEQLTEYTPGLETWEFASMLAMANRGLYVAAVEKFSPELFIKDTRTAIKAQVGDESIVEHIYKVSDVPCQVDLVRECIANPRIQFVPHTPSLDEMIDVLQGEAKLLVNVNSRVLRGKEGYAGHMVFVHDYSKHKFTVEDPGPPAYPGRRIDAGLFRQAWHSPTEGMANFIAASTAPLPFD